ncbi:hypothetical protein [Paenimyroides aestuarii]|uniref:Uncharacterized protein n=1 Tax=Paenimyroides aestuarii TaxID=2968490 RepID=A0ABY5NP13_9FLAO|nr:hypothetical protein [Paenimyroides aestuarii]UUV20268.1 hypothetical protein NPX36_07780 [Paenimyroides aestuarii]
MKNKLHTTVCHSEGVSKSKESPTIFYVLYAILLILCSLPVTAQPYQWQWAIKGGSSGAGVSSGGWHIYAEQIYDIAIDNNNNYYFVASIAGSNPQLNGQSVIVYNNIATNNDIFLFSTTCDGQVRWNQAIGGGQLLIELLK